MLKYGHDMTIEEARRWPAGIPKEIVSPTAAIVGRFRLSGTLGISASVAASRGVFVSGGPAFGF
jgi:hypothetical protein